MSSLMFRFLKLAGSVGASLGVVAATFPVVSCIGGSTDSDEESKTPQLKFGSNLSTVNTDQGNMQGAEGGHNETTDRSLGSMPGTGLTSTLASFESTTQSVEREVGNRAMVHAGNTTGIDPSMCLPFEEI